MSRIIPSTMPIPIVTQRKNSIKTLLMPTTAIVDRLTLLRNITLDSTNHCDYTCAVKGAGSLWV